MKISQKFSLALSVLLLMSTGILTYVALSGVMRLGQRLASVYTDAVLPLVKANEIESAIERMNLALVRAVHSPDAQRER